MTVSAPDANFSAQLGRLIDQSTKLLQQLEPLLETELQALQDRNTDLLTQNNQLKLNCLSELDRAIKARDELLHQQQVSPTSESVLEFFQNLPAPANTLLTQAWEKLESQLESVKKLNMRNEQVLLRSKQSTDQLLALLQGHARSNTVYNNSGDEGRYEGQRSLGKA
ncbi:flagellar export chaperone FlgN [Nitrincola sp.]|uniref:flagellar export chaperone FlgN n=1 Tax=Nitrincola sp. TaxID=1926584 RepID=UPI003A8F2B1D